MSARLIISPVTDEQNSIFGQAVYLTKHITPTSGALPGAPSIPLLVETDWQIATRSSAARKITIVLLNSGPFDDVDVHELFMHDGYINTQSIVWVTLPNGKEFYMTGDFDEPPKFHGIFGDLLIVQVREQVYSISLTNDLQVIQTFTLSQELGIYKNAEISITETNQVQLHVGYLLRSEVNYFDSAHNDSLSTTWETFDLEFPQAA
jgi:hypothetical protein